MDIVLSKKNVVVDAGEDELDPNLLLLFLLQYNQNWFYHYFIKTLDNANCKNSLLLERFCIHGGSD